MLFREEDAGRKSYSMSLIVSGDSDLGLLWTIFRPALQALWNYSDLRGICLWKWTEKFLEEILSL